MKVEGLLRTKGNEVATIAPGASVRDTVAELAQRRVGALVVSDNGQRIVGIVSERDVVRALADAGAALLDQPVSSIMTPEVRTCTAQTTVDELMTVMTAQRIRHVPVVDADVLAGIVSIGDIVKSRMSQLEQENRAVHEYIGQGR